MDGVTWNHLPKELARIILHKLSLQSFIRAAAVCRTWADAYKELRDSCPPRTPSMWLVSVHRDMVRSSVAAKFYGLGDGLSDLIEQPLPTHNYFLLGSAYGWVVILDDKYYKPLLLNPLTRSTMSLPSIGFAKPALPIRKFNQTYKFILSSRPDSNGGCTVVFLDSHRIYLTHVNASDDDGGKQWLSLETTAAGQPENYYNNVPAYFYRDAMFHQGRLYVVDNLGTVEMWDNFDQLDHERDTLGPATVVLDEPYRFGYLPNEIRGFVYLVSAPWGDLLVLQRFCCQLVNPKTIMVHVRKIDLTEMRSTRVWNLGDYSIFIGLNNSECLSVNDVPGMRANCIYFSDDFLWRHQNEDIGVYSLENNNFERIGDGGSQSHWPPPIWVIPSV